MIARTTNLTHDSNKLGYHSKSLQELRRLDLEHWSPPIRQILDDARNEVPKVIVTGAKGAGKSTFCRILINNILTWMSSQSPTDTRAFQNGLLFLDIDLGQPELMAPGMVYLAHLKAPLLGPSFTNIILPGANENRIVRMHYLGANTPRQCPLEYGKSVSDLLSLSHQYDGLPLIVNTCGWNSGSGLAMLAAAIGDEKFSDIIQIGEVRRIALDLLENLKIRGEHKILTQVSPQPNRTPLKSAKDLREMQLQSYMHAIRVSPDQTLWDSLPLSTMPTFEFPASHVLNNLYMVVIIGEDLAPQYLDEAMDGAVVAIVMVKHDSPLYELQERTQRAGNSTDAGFGIAYTPSGGLPYLVRRDRAVNPLDPATTECLGMAYVKVRSKGKRTLSLRSPVSSNRIRTEMDKGHKLALVLAQQQGMWSTHESILARGQLPEISPDRNIQEAETNTIPSHMPAEAALYGMDSLMSYEALGRRNGLG
jgi:polynucleotide 5'-hydroxyl-kinase GRC3/NOL9